MAESALEPVLVVVPTYNERENLGPIIARLHAARSDAHVLVVDDGSPDGTGELADELAAADNRVHVLHRTEKAGLGVAYVAGFRWGIEHGYAVLVEMDADGSHAPEELPSLLAALGNADLVLGSRYVPGGRVVNWPLLRQFISRGGNFYTRVALGVPKSDIADLTGGYRAFRREVLEKLPLAEVASHGYCFQVDLAWRTRNAGFRVVEVPIVFTERELGDSKMSGKIFREALWRVTQWGMQRRYEQARSLLRRVRR